MNENEPQDPSPLHLKNVLESPLLGLGLGGRLPVCKSLFWTPWAVCPWANSIPSLSLHFLVAMGCKDFLG